LGYQSSYPLYIKFDLPEYLGFLKDSGYLKLEIEKIDNETFIDLDEYSDTLNFLTSIIWNVQSHLHNYENNLEKIDSNTVSEMFVIPKQILENLKLYSPVQDIRFNKTVNIYLQEKHILIDNIRLEFKINGIWLPWSQLSDGTKRLFYIIAETTYSNGLILIEEPELGIHPHQFNLLMNFLKEQSETKQILISTHSPKALDHLSEDELDSILIASYNLKKGTQIRHLTTDEIKKAKKYMNEVGFFSDYWMFSDLEE
jgi:predicted ATPase